MRKATVYDITKTNIAFLGSDEDIAARKSAAKTEAAWQSAGQAEGVEAWRIEKFQVVPNDNAKKGVFYSGDSYIVLHTQKKENKLVRDIYFWLGRDTSQDEAGTAAYKTVELDDFFDGEPIEHRETQDYESKSFSSLFEVIRTLDGGIDSGFSHVEEKDYKPRLLHIKGKTNKVCVRQVPLECSSLNAGDAFILDLGKSLYQWHGESVGMAEKSKAATLARALDDERGNVEINVVTQGEGDCANMYSNLGGSEADIKTVEQVASDSLTKPSNKIFKVSDASGTLTTELVAEGADCSYDKLESGDVFIVDVGTEVFVWVGSGASTNERRKAMATAMQYLADNGRPAYLPITRTLESAENEALKAFIVA